MLEKEANRKAQDLEEAAHPFWNAGFWKSPPARLISMFLDGDQHRLTTPPTHREKLASAEYLSEREIKKFRKRDQIWAIAAQRRGNCGRHSTQPPKLTKADLHVQRTLASRTGEHTLLGFRVQPEEVLANSLISNEDAS